MKKVLGLSLVLSLTACGVSEPSYYEPELEFEDDGFEIDIDIDKKKKKNLTKPVTPAKPKSKINKAMQDLQKKKKYSSKPKKTTTY